MTIPGVAEGLAQRFRDAGARIQWRDLAAPKGRRGRPPTASPRTRIAHLHDEEARIEEVPDRRLVESGPVGALVLLLEVDRRGPPTGLVALTAGTRPGFGQGAIEARWDGRASEGGSPVPLNDLVELARYALV